MENTLTVDFSPFKFSSDE